MIVIRQVGQRTGTSVAYTTPIYNKSKNILKSIRVIIIWTAVRYIGQSISHIPASLYNTNNKV